VAHSELPGHAHLGQEDRDTLKKEAGEALAWLQDKLAMQVGGPGLPRAVVAVCDFFPGVAHF
jgi:hypothetical protein